MHATSIRFGIAAAALMTAAAAAHGQEIELPKGMAASPAEPAVKPDSGGVEWKVVLVNDQPVIFADSAARTRMAWQGADKPAFGDVFHVMAESTGGRKRFLLARFTADRKFRGWVGWVDPEWVMDNDAPLKVKDAREYLLRLCPEGDPRRERVDNEMPVAARADLQNVTLKAVTHPERGKYCFLRPVLPDGEPAAIKAKVGVPLQPFTFFYIYKVVVLPENIYCLVSARPSLDLVSTTESTNFKGALLGWIEMRNLTLWTSREAFEYNLTEEARSARKKANSPIELYKTQGHLSAAVKARAAGRPVPPTSVFTEDFAAGYMLAPWKPNMMRYPILDRYPLTGARLADGREAIGYQLCVLGNAGTGKLDLDPREFDKLKGKVNDAIKNLRVFEIVLLINRTATMDPLYGVVMQACRQMIRDIRDYEEAQKIPEIERVVVRIGVVGFWNFADDDPIKQTPKLTEPSPDFFDVSSADSLASFERYMSLMTARGGGGLLVQPFEGVRTALDYFLSDKPDSKHTKGAARMIVLFSNHGNHEKAPGAATKLDADDVIRMLKSPDSGSAKSSPITFVAIRTPFNQKPSEEWDKQMPKIAEATGGFAKEISFAPANPAKVPPAQLKKELVKSVTDALRQAVEDRRKILRQEIDAVRRMFARGGAVELESMPITNFARSRMEQMIPTDELSKIQTSLSGFFFTNLHAVEQLPDDPANMPRLELSVLLTLQELIEIQNVCDTLARELDHHLAQVNPEAGDTKAVFKDLLVRTLITVMGNQSDVAPSELIKMRNLPLEKIQEKVNSLPVIFGCLKGQGPADRAEVTALAKRLKKISGDMKAVLAVNKERLFDPGVGAGEMHIWVRPSELP